MLFSPNDIAFRRKKVSLLFDEILQRDEGVIIHSGQPIQKPGGLDTCYPFIPHPAYYWLTARLRPGETLFYNKDLGWMNFQVSDTGSIWEDQTDDVLVEEMGLPQSDLPDFLKKGAFKSLYLPGQAYQLLNNTEKRLKLALDTCRRIKDESEIALVKQMAEAAAFGYRMVESLLMENVTERELQIAYEAEVFRNGANQMPYESIIAAGKKAAVLHHLPTSQKLKSGDLLLIDAGAALYGYCVDITRVYYCGETPDSRSKALYQLVLKAQQAVMEKAVAGVQWRDLHLYAAQIICEGLMELGILKGSLEQLQASEVIALFFPHGLGHLVGLGVRDTGHEENSLPRTAAGVHLRVDLKLEENMLITVEPGCYFIERLLYRPENKTRFKDLIDYAELEHWKDIGGVRIEDNLLIQKENSINLTAGVEKTKVFNSI